MDVLWPWLALWFVGVAVIAAIGIIVTQREQRRAFEPCEHAHVTRRCITCARKSHPVGYACLCADIRPVCDDCGGRMG